MSGFYPSAETVRMDWGVPLQWARNYPAWPERVRDFLAQARASGLTVITVRLERQTVELIATKPGDEVGDYA
jgi:hypothetical protein